MIFYDISVTCGCAATPIRERWAGDMKSLFILLLCVMIGCSRQQPVPVTIAETASPHAGRFIECDESEAEKVLEVFVTVKGEFERWPFVIPVRTATSTDWSRGGGYFCAAGSDGGFSGHINVEPGPDDSVPLNVSLQYSSKRGHGKLEELIETIVDQDGTITVNDNGVWILDWSWRPKKPIAAQH